MRGIISKVGPRWRAAIGVAILLVLTEAMFLRPSMLSGSMLQGYDFIHLLARRMAFAQSALFAARHTIPGWHPPAFLGLPFSANIHIVPWHPTRLLLLPPAHH